MQVLLLGMFVALFLHDATTAVEIYRGGELARVAEALPGDVWPRLDAWVVLLVVLLPKLFIVLMYWAACRRTRKRLGSNRGQRSLNRLEAMTTALPLLLLCLFIVDLSAGFLRTTRLVLRQVVLIDEVLTILPTLLVVVFTWAAYFPVDRRLREALIMRDADAGRPVYPLLSRRSYIVMQLRHQFGLLLLPLLAVFGWSEMITLLGPDNAGPLSEQAVALLTPLGVIAVFITAPLVIRYVWQTAPLPDGEVRERMLALCKQHGVRVRELLLWRTSGRMINAAVTGVISKVRYILLSDGLLDQLGPREVEAVMAHELAHVKLKHLIWMGLVLIVSIGLVETAMYKIIGVVISANPAKSSDIHEPMGPAWLDVYDPQVQLLIAGVPAFAIAIAAFGWVSRRIERQADVFAVRHLAMSTDHEEGTDHNKQAFDRPAVETMVHALQRVAELNHASVTRKSWRHGSIAWRQAHLRSLVGQPLDSASVDRVLVRVKLATLVGMLLLLGHYLA